MMYQIKCLSNILKQRIIVITLIACLLLSLLTIHSKALAAYDLMIICPEDFVTALEPLVDHKVQMGISVRIKTLDSIDAGYQEPSLPDDPARIKRAIYDQYQAHGIQYVMLVGDGNVFPVRYIKGELEDYSPEKTDGHIVRIWEPSDFYYAEILDESGGFDTWDSNGNNIFSEIYRNHINLDEIDYTPQVYVGRVPATDVDQVRNYVAKVIYYERKTYDEAVWFKNMTFSVNHDPHFVFPSNSSDENGPDS